MSKKPVIVFEGIEGSGKSFHSRNLSNYLKNPKSGNPELFLETHEGPQKPKNITLWNEHDRDVHWWNLSIDLSFECMPKYILNDVLCL